jgi:trehalose monomycolate/heme transporter
VIFSALSNFMYRQRWFVLVAGLVFLVVSAVYGTSLFGRLKSGGFLDPNAESSKAIVALHNELNRPDATLVVLFTAGNGLKVDQPEYKTAVEQTLAKLNGRSDIGTISTFYTTGAPQFVSKDRTATFAAVGMNGSEEALEKTLKEIRPLLKSDALQVRLGGDKAVFEEINKQVSEDLKNAELMTFPILAVLLVFIFGSLVASALPLAIGGASILGAFLILRLLSEVTDISVFSINVITMLGLGLAIDYSLFMVSRFREELTKRDGDVQAALNKTMQTAGRTVFFSGLTVAISMLSLLVFPQMFLQSMGLGGAAAVMVAALISLTVLPATLAVLGKRVNSLSVRFWQRNKPATTDFNKGFWYSISRFVMRRPVVVLVIVLVPMLAAGLPFFRINLVQSDARALPPTAESRIVSEILTNDFPRNETTPVQIIVRTPQPALSETSLNALYDYTRQIQALPGVLRVDSAVTLSPLLTKEAYRGFYSDANLSQNPQARQAAEFYAKGNSTALTVIYAGDPFGNDTQKLVRDIRSLSLPAGMSVQVGGVTAELIDFLGSLSTTVPLALGLVVAVIFVLLFLMLGSIVIPVKAVILNIVSLSVSFGALVLIFQDGNFANFLRFTPVGGVDATQPILIFAIAFGLSMDYEVFLLSRIKEQYDRTGDMTASVAYGVQKTGGIITSAALLLFVVIASFATGEISFIKQIGVGLGLAILVDATVVRMFLVPATMRLMGKYNWWSPAPLTALYRKAGFSEVEHDEEPAATKPETREPVAV